MIIERVQHLNLPSMSVRNIPKRPESLGNMLRAVSIEDIVIKIKDFMNVGERSIGVYNGKTETPSIYVSDKPIRTFKGTPVIYSIKSKDEIDLVYSKKLPFFTVRVEEFFVQNGYNDFRELQVCRVLHMPLIDQSVKYTVGLRGVVVASSINNEEISANISRQIASKIEQLYKNTQL